MASGFNSARSKRKTNSKLNVPSATQNLALLRRIGKDVLRGKLPLQTLRLNALNREGSFKRSNRQKLNRAAMDNNYMLTILAACLSQHNEVSESACQ